MLKMPNSTRASDMLQKRAFIPNMDDSINEDLKDISGIVADMSNIEETSFAVDIFKDKSILQKTTSDTNNIT